MGLPYPAPHEQRFQCSSASRKFLNLVTLFGRAYAVLSFSALQRAENSSMRLAGADARRPHVSVLFSEPKIPQSARRLLFRRREHSVSVLFSEPKIPQLSDDQRQRRLHLGVSVLFSEPKIPQCAKYPTVCRRTSGFSALQRAENSSMGMRGERIIDITVFQCSSASRKFLNWDRPGRAVV